MKDLGLAYYDVITDESIKVIYYIDGIENNSILSVKNAFEYDKDMIIDEIKKQNSK
jgi:hypothetical protein